MREKAKITKENGKTIISLESDLKIRGSFGQVKPFTRVHNDKTKYSRKEKHKKDFNSEDLGKDIIL